MDICEIIDDTYADLQENIKVPKSIQTFLIKSEEVIPLSHFHKARLLTREINLDVTFPKHAWSHSLVNCGWIYFNGKVIKDCYCVYMETVLTVEFGENRVKPVQLVVKNMFNGKIQDFMKFKEKYPLFIYKNGQPPISEGDNVTKVVNVKKTEKGEMSSLCKLL